MAPSARSAPSYVFHLARGGELLRAGELEAARAELEQACALDPTDPRAKSLLAVACFRAGRFAEARALYGELVTAEPDDASLRLNLGLVLLKAGHYDAAVTELSHALELGAPSARASGYLGLAFAQSGRFAEARDAFRAAGQEELAHDMEEQLAVANDLAAIDEDLTRAATVSTPDIVLELPEPAPPQVVRAPEPADTFAREHGVLTVGAFATEALISPDGHLAGVDLPFEIAAAGTLVVRVRGRILSRTEGVLVSGGALAYEPATRRVGETVTDQPFGSASRPVFFVSGTGHMVAAPRGGVFTALRLRDDVVYLREDLVYAFEEQLEWENGEVHGSEGSIPLVGLQGTGCVAMRTRGAPLTVKLAAGKMLYVDAAALAGWIGQIAARVVEPAAGGAASAPFVECTGEGVLLVEDPAGLEII